MYFTKKQDTQDKTFICDSGKSYFVGGCSGCGKTRSIIIPSVQQCNSNYLVFDNFSSVYKETIGELSSNGYTVLKLPAYYVFENTQILEQAIQLLSHQKVAVFITHCIDWGNPSMTIWIMDILQKVKALNHTAKIPKLAIFWDDFQENYHLAPAPKGKINFSEYSVSAVFKVIESVCCENIHISIFIPTSGLKDIMYMCEQQEMSQIYEFYKELGQIVLFDEINDKFVEMYLN